MLHLIPAPLHRLVLRLGHRVRLMWRVVTRLPSAGVAVIGMDDAGRVLLARHGYGSGRWSLPGGGLGRREDPADCARREMREELDCELEDLRLAAKFGDTLFGAPHTAYVFTARFIDEPRIDGREIVECGWFELDNLPPEIASFATYRLKLAFPDL